MKNFCVLDVIIPCLDFLKTAVALAEEDASNMIIDLRAHVNLIRFKEKKFTSKTSSQVFG